MIEVYHNERFLDHPGFSWGTKYFPHRRDLKLAALVETDDLEKAYELTNNINWPWPDNPEVECMTDKPRSTSCGDCIRDGSGAWWVCAGVGWEKFDPYAKPGPGAGMMGNVNGEADRGQLDPRIEMEG